MAAPPQNKSFSIEDFKNAPDWFQRFLAPLNQFMGDTYACLAGNLTAGDNLARQRKVVSIQAFSATTFPLKFTNALATTPYDVHIGQVLPLSSGDTLTNPVALTSWRMAGDQIQIDGVTGLNTGKQYRITFVYE